MIPLKDNIRHDRFPVVTVALALASVVVYLLSIRHGGGLVSGPSDGALRDGAAIPYALTHPGSHATASGQLPTWLRPLSAMFMHSSLLHLAADLLFLAIFGPTIEDAMGRVRFLAFYVVGGLVALGVQVAVDPGSTAPIVGASGALGAVVAAYFVCYPRARILTVVLVPFFFTIVEVPAVVLLVAWIAIEIAFAAAGVIEPVGGNATAYVAAVGGLAFGACSVRLFATRRGAVPRRRVAA